MGEAGQSGTQPCLPALCLAEGLLGLQACPVHGRSLLAEAKFCLLVSFLTSQIIPSPASVQN